MYELLRDVARRPEPFSRYTVPELWTRPHLARQMLDFHLDQETDLASSRFETIDRVVDWIDSQLELSGKRLCDLGCGPGLYALRFAEKGADVTGVDFSANSLTYAARCAAEKEQAIRYVHADYLIDELPGGFDVITLIYTDYGVLSPGQRRSLLGRMQKMLKPGGNIVFDVAATGAFSDREGATRIENQLMDGFWAEGEYVGIQRTFVYPEAFVSLDRYVIVEPDTTWEIFNWMQYYTPKRLRTELNDAGFEVLEMVGGLAGEPLGKDGSIIGVIACLK